MFLHEHYYYSKSQFASYASGWFRQFLLINAHNTIKFFIAILYILSVTWSEYLVKFLANFLYSADVFIKLSLTTPITFPVRFLLIPKLFVYMNGLQIFSPKMNFLAFVNLETHQATWQPGIGFAACSVFFTLNELR